MWMFDLFEVAWGLRDATEDGADPLTQRMIRLAKAERAIRRLYRAIDELPSHERFPFSDPMEDLLATTVATQERWVSHRSLPTQGIQANQETGKDSQSLTRGIRVPWYEAHS
jgi:hypothetical protein